MPKFKVSEVGVIEAEDFDEARTIAGQKYAEDVLGEGAGAGVFNTVSWSEDRRYTEIRFMISDADDRNEQSAFFSIEQLDDA